METLYPSGYGTAMVTMATLRRMHEPNMHPEAARRGFAFIERMGGKFGIGSGYRPPGKQPDGKPGFAPPGMSFHEGQPFLGRLYYVAWDMVVVNPGSVHRSPKFVEVPLQGSQFAIDCGVHMNVKTEAWHMQPIELDGYTTWKNQGMPGLRMNYPIKSLTPPPVVPTPVPTPPPSTPSTGDDMQVRLIILRDSDAQFLAQTDDQGQALIVTWAGPGSPDVDRAVAAHRAEALRKNHPFEQQANAADLFNCVYFGDTLPFGDSRHNWTKRDFWRTVGVAN